MFQLKYSLYPNFILYNLGGKGLNELNFLKLDNNKGFINLRFMHKLNWMKTEWVQASFCSLV